MKPFPIDIAILRHMLLLDATRREWANPEPHVMARYRARLARGEVPDVSGEVEES